MKTAESPTTTSECSLPDQRVSRQPSGTRSLNFQQIRDDRSATWNAALDATVEVTKGGRPDLFLVSVDDDCPANCSLAEHPNGTHAGWCSCEVFQATTVCPHLCVLRQYAALNKLDLPERTSDS
ncbi:hypothetical protein SAMN05443574_12515 [Haloarcula vallismortis]|uniref:SWIM-type domain-containing protein n=2 Tax=Haloarcula vallismortis TaxID=28442 RepID=M0JIJ7_HALVA|nr:hypothetical protein [Haloarcula vallismortis]EMA07819.1 hypothetical protein C437_08843 [Haloarcula vallismortis ATCC 29715]SDX29228.1 hypothetical protein SAMN05443574_12515 [Haloarcula vallismortis]